MIPNALVSSYRDKSPTTYKFAKSWKKQADLTRLYPGKLSKRINKSGQTTKGDM